MGWLKNRNLGVTPDDPWRPLGIPCMLVSCIFLLALLHHGFYHLCQWVLLLQVPLSSFPLNFIFYVHSYGGAGRAPGICFNLCPTSDLLGGALRGRTWHYTTLDVWPY